MANRWKRRPVRFLMVSVCLAGATVTVMAPRGWAAAPDGPQEVIEVFPGPNAITEALAQADEGDVLNIHAGRYPEAVVVSTANVALRSAGDGRVIVDGECSTRYTISVLADGVKITGLAVIGAAHGFGEVPSAVRFDQVSSGMLRNSILADSCDAEYGVNVFNGGTVVIRGNVATGFGDGGIYAGTVRATPFGPLRIEDNESFGNFRGVIVYGVTGGRVRVDGNHVHDNSDSGIRVNFSTGVLTTRNRVVDNVRTGIELINESNDNAVIENLASGHEFDLANTGGTGNCWARNVYTTSIGDISC